MRQIEEVGQWLKQNQTANVYISGIYYMTYIQQYIAENDGNKRIHVLKVEFMSEVDANRFLMEWG